MERAKWTDKIKNEVVFRKSGRRTNNAEFGKEEKRKLVGLLIKKKSAY